MKTTKRIIKLAEGLAVSSAKDHLKWYNEHLPAYYEREKERQAETVADFRKMYIKELTQIKNALLKGRYYTGVQTVSKSGMSRTIKLAYIYNNKLKTINDPLLLELAGVDKNGRIGGCGMDMLFHAQYNLFINLHRTHKEAHYQKRMARYNDL